MGEGRTREEEEDVSEERSELILQQNMDTMDTAIIIVKDIKLLFLNYVFSRPLSGPEYNCLFINEINWMIKSIRGLCEVRRGVKTVE